MSSWRGTSAPVETAHAPAFGRLHKLGVLGFAALLVGLQLSAMLQNNEDWPFTAAPMFARYHAAGQRLVEFRVFLAPTVGAEFELEPKRDLGIGELGFRRQFFRRYYGSSDDESARSPEQAKLRFRLRLSEWCKRVTTVAARRRSQELKGLRLEAWVRDGDATKRVVIANYAPKTGVLDWRARSPREQARRELD